MAAPLWFISGPPGIGKTEVGRALKPLVDAVVYDVDIELERMFEQSISDFIQLKGWSAFRQAEFAMISALIERTTLIGERETRVGERTDSRSTSELSSSLNPSAIAPVVISLGGGSVTSNATRALIRASGILVTLWASVGLIQERQRQRALQTPERDRPLPSLELDKLLASRLDGYLDCDIWLESLEGESASQLATRVCRASRHYAQGSRARWLSPPPIHTLTALVIHEIAPLEETHEVAPLEEVHEVAPLEEVHEVAPLEEIHEVAPLEEVHEVAPLEEVHEVESLEEVHEVRSREVSDEAQEASSFAPLTLNHYPVHFAYQSPSTLLELLSQWAQLTLTPPEMRRKLIIMSDEIVARLHGAPLVGQLQALGVNAHLITFPVGEQSKSLRVLESLVTQLLHLHVDRDDKIIALGGGVTGDLCGLLAALYLRGVEWAQIPTTVLAQVDSSVGAKTAVNHPLGKNLIGAFYRPAWVWIDELYLSTLSLRQIRAGWVEAFKHGLIRDAALARDLGEIAPSLHSSEREPIIWGSLLKRSVVVKASIVERDEHERGERALLNFGHTLGHALESTHRALLHGEAVALGMCAIAEYSARYGSFDVRSVEYIYDRLQRAELRTDWRAFITPNVWRALTLDKKRTRDSIRLILVNEIGHAYIEDTPVQDVIERLTALSHQPRSHLTVDHLSTL